MWTFQISRRTSRWLWKRKEKNKCTKGVKNCVKNCAQHSLGYTWTTSKPHIHCHKWRLIAWVNWIAWKLHSEWQLVGIARLQTLIHRGHKWRLGSARSAVLLSTTNHWSTQRAYLGPDGLRNLEFTNDSYKQHRDEYRAARSRVPAAPIKKKVVDPRNYRWLKYKRDIDHGVGRVANYMKNYQRVKCIYCAKSAKRCTGRLSGQITRPSCWAIGHWKSMVNLNCICGK